MHSKDNLSIVIVGNPKACGYKEKIVRDFKNIGIAMTAPPHEKRSMFLKLILNGIYGVEKCYIKPHPLDNSAHHLEMINNENIMILGIHSSIEEFVNDIDVLCVRRSQIGSDALSYDIPIIVCDGIQDGDLQNGQVLNEKAGCPIVNNSEALQIELFKLKTNNTYLETRLKCQKDYYNNLYSHVGFDSVLEMGKALHKLISTAQEY